MHLDLHAKRKGAQYSYLFACSSSNYTSSQAFSLLQQQKKYSALYSWLEPPWELWLDCFTTSRLQQAGGSTQQQLMKNLPASPLNWSLASNHDVNFVPALKTYLLLLYDVMYMYWYTILYAICWLYLGLDIHCTLQTHIMHLYDYINCQHVSYPR